MNRCRICARPIDGTPAMHVGTYGDVHAACLADQIPQDAAAALIALVVLVLAPAIVVWAG